MKYAGENATDLISRRWPSTTTRSGAPAWPGQEIPAAVPSIGADWASGMVSVPWTAGTR
jgi:hypothetical protein